MGLALCLMLIMSLMLCLIFLLVMDNTFFSHQKIMEFECGFNSIVSTRLSFSLQYFMVTILFLVFDLEIILIMPVIQEMKLQIVLFSLLVFMFMLLILGLLMEWVYGLVDWSK